MIWKLKCMYVWMNCSALLLHVQFTYEVCGCVLTASGTLHMHTYRYSSAAKSRSASGRTPITVDAWIYLHNQTPCEQHAWTYRYSLYLLCSLTGKKDRIIHLPVKSSLRLPSHVCPASKQQCVYLTASRGQSTTPVLPCLP